MHAAFVGDELLAGIEARAGEVAHVHAHADARVAVLHDGPNLLRRAIDRVLAVVVDGELDVVFLHEFFEAVPQRLVVLRLDDDDLDAHRLGEDEELAVHFLVRRGAGHAEGVKADALRIEDGLLRLRFVERAGRVDVIADGLEMLEAVLLGEGDDFLKLHVAASPRLEADLGRVVGGLGGGEEKAGQGQREEHFCFHLLEKVARR